MKGTVEAVCTSDSKGPKQCVDRIQLRRGHGVEGDVHAGTWHRQVSLLALEHIETMRETIPDLGFGAFGENIVICDLDPAQVAIGRRLRIGADAVLQITQHGKQCHDRCEIYETVGDCIMPRSGTFARVVRSGAVEVGSELAADPSFDRVRFGVITVSDRGAAGEREDGAGPLVAELLQSAIGGLEVAREIVADDRRAISGKLVELCDEHVCDLVVTTGGTGLSPRDVTPDATFGVIDREIPGMAEAMRTAGLSKTPHAMLSRAVCGQRGQTLIVNLSGSPRAVREQLEVLEPVLAHALETATGIPQDCAVLRDE
jgi:molybdenum cofactor synthesis domain-containing protein